jgi:pimeloyl-ACP methyl ester carboxylesterase
MTPLADCNALINGSRIAHGVHGKGEPVLLLHGTPSSSLIWRNVMPRLVEAGYRVHLYDLLGFGLSERPWSPEVDTSVTAQVPYLEGLLEHWGLDDLHVIGHDIGGAVAKRFALQSPERIRSLTLIDIVSYDSWPSKRTREQMQAGLEKLINTPDAEHRAHFRDWLLSAVVDKAAFEGSSLDSFLEYISGPVGQASLFQHQIMHYDPRHTNDIAARLGELGNLPVQLIWGRDDAWQVEEWGHRLHGDIPGSELHLLDDCGHFAMEDQLERISALLLDFLHRNG